MEFVKLLRERGAKVFVTDINTALVQRAVDDYGAEAVGRNRGSRRARVCASKSAAVVDRRAGRAVKVMRVCLVRWLGRRR